MAACSFSFSLRTVKTATRRSLEHSSSSDTMDNSYICGVSLSIGNVYNVNFWSKKLSDQLC